MTISPQTALRYICAIAVTLSLAGCSGSDDWKKVNVSAIPVTVHTARFERDFFALDTNNLVAGETAIRAKYGDWYHDYITRIMNFGRPDNRLDTADHDPHIDMRLYLGSQTDRQDYEEVQRQYADISDIEQGITDMSRHFKYYFPRQPAVTEIITFTSQFGNGLLTYGDSTVAVGLDLYLGEKFPYDRLGFPEFMKRKLRREYIVPNATEALYNLHFDKSAYNAELPLIEAIINEGKKYYFMEALLPATPDSILIGYTRVQEEWCRASEGQIWKYMNEKDLLYKVNYMEQKRYTSDGPTTAGMPPESPGRVGSWVGWQIVRKFMKNNRGKVTLDDLMYKYSAKQILSQANYKPK